MDSTMRHRLMVRPREVSPSKVMMLRIHPLFLRQPPSPFSSQTLSRNDSDPANIPHAATQKVAVEWHDGANPNESTHSI